MGFETDVLDIPTNIAPSIAPAPSLTPEPIGTSNGVHDGEYEYLNYAGVKERYGIPTSTLCGKARAGIIRRDARGGFNVADLERLVNDPVYKFRSSKRGHRPIFKGKRGESNLLKEEVAVKKPGGYVSLSEASRLTGRPVPTIRQHVLDGKLPAIKMFVGNRMQYMVARVDMGLPPEVKEQEAVTPKTEQELLHERFLALAEQVRKGERRLKAFSATVEYTVE